MIVQIAPSVPPKVCGVGDYAAHLADGWRTMGIDSYCYVPPYQHAGFWGTYATMTDQGIEQQLNKLGTSTLLLHFSGYGYGQYGVCSELAQAIVRWRSATAARRLFVMFHEVHVEVGPFWRRGFWVYERQRRIAKTIASVADCIFVTSTRGAEQLKSLSFSAKVWPVFSNVGEPAERAALKDRSPEAIIFGVHATRQETIKKLAADKSIVRWLYGNSIERIVSIGPGVDARTKIGPISIESLGPLTSRDISERLSSSQVGLISYRPNYVTKSGVIAAYIAHGMLVLNLFQPGKPLVETQQSNHSEHVDPRSAEITDLQAIVDLSANDYRHHSTSATCAMLLHCMQSL